jgi:hypothetical protein
MVSEDFPLAVAVIWHMWRSHKIGDEQALKDLTFCRDYRADSAVGILRGLILKEQQWTRQQKIKTLQDMLQSQQQEFLKHPVVDKWVASFSPSAWGARRRWPSLILLGPSMVGKTCRAVDLWGHEKTLKVSCNGLQNGLLPSLKDFDRERHSAIVFDELQPEQILANREIFQAGVHENKLSQSACGQHEYRVWLYCIPLIGCTNSLDIDRKRPTYAGDKEWLDKNLVVVSLAAGQTWFAQPNGP